MSISQLSTEILQKIYGYTTIQDAIHLSITSQRNLNAFLGRKLPILQQAFYNSPYSPYPELIKLVICGLPDTNRKLVGTEVRRRSILNHCVSVGVMPVLSLDFIKKLVYYGKVAARWTELYPQLRWRFDSDERRILQPHEAERLRRAIYQYWTFCNLFQDQDYCQWDPEPPRAGPHNRNDLRLRLARTWTTIDIVRQSEFVDKLRQIVEIDLCPSNAVIQHRFSRSFSQKQLAKYAWGDEEESRRLGDALLKLNPAEILHLYLYTTTKSERLEYFKTMGRWFDIPYSWDITVRIMAADERRRPHPSFPASTCSVIFPYVDLEDKDVPFGIIDCCEKDGPDYFRTHVYANDASPTGEWIDEYDRPTFFSPLWMAEKGEDNDDLAESWLVSLVPWKTDELFRVVHKVLFILILI